MTQEEASTMNRRVPGWASTCTPGLTIHWPSQGLLSSCHVSGGTGRQRHTWGSLRSSQAERQT